MFRKFKRLLKGNKGKKQQLPLAFREEFRRLKELEDEAGKRFALNEADFYPCLDDNTSYTGFDRHYVYHPAWAARILRRVSPEKHIDISSTLHFCSLLSAFIPVDFYDYRPARLELDDLRSLPADLLALPFERNSVMSLSCMHTLEHIGLGRYGDRMDYNGDIKAAAELQRVLAPGGHLLMVVPVGQESRIYFNAHRIYTKQQALNLFPDLTLKEFALIPEDEQDGGLVTDPGEALLNKQVYGCGCFYFTK